MKYCLLGAVIGLLIILAVHEHDDTARQHLFTLMKDGSYVILTPKTNCSPHETICGYNTHKVDPEKVKEFISEQ